MDDYAGRVLADRYRLPLPPSDAYELTETRAFDTYSGQEVLVRQVPLPEVVEAEVLDAEGLPAGFTARERASRRAPEARAATRQPADPAVRRAVEAAQAAARIPDHPRLDQVFDVFAEGGSLWIVSELVAARPLAALLTEQPLTPYRAAEVASDVLMALRVLHAHGWVHRNITVRTVLVCDDGRVMLTGLAAGAAEEALCGYDPVPAPEDPEEPEELEELEEDGADYAGGGPLGLGPGGRTGGTAGAPGRTGVPGGPGRGRRSRGRAAGRDPGAGSRRTAGPGDRRPVGRRRSDGGSRPSTAVPTSAPPGPGPSPRTARVPEPPPGCTRPSRTGAPPCPVPVSPPRATPAPAGPDGAAPSPYSSRPSYPEHSPGRGRCGAARPDSRPLRGARRPVARRLPAPWAAPPRPWAAARSGRGCPRPTPLPDSRPCRARGTATDREWTPGGERSGPDRPTPGSGYQGAAPAHSELAPAAAPVVPAQSGGRWDEPGAVRRGPGTALSRRAGAAGADDRGGTGDRALGAGAGRARARELAAGGADRPGHRPVGAGRPAVPGGAGARAVSGGVDGRAGAVGVRRAARLRRGVRPAAAGRGVAAAPGPHRAAGREELGGWLRSLVRSAPEPDAGTHVVPVPPADPSRLPIVRRRGELVRRRRAGLPATHPHGRHKAGQGGRTFAAQPRPHPAPADPAPAGRRDRLRDAVHAEAGRERRGGRRPHRQCRTGGPRAHAHPAALRRAEHAGRRRHRLRARDRDPDRRGPHRPRRVHPAQGSGRLPGRRRRGLGPHAEERQRPGGLRPREVRADRRTRAGRHVRVRQRSDGLPAGEGARTPAVPRLQLGHGHRAADHRGGRTDHGRGAVHLDRRAGAGPVRAGTWRCC
ncbi:protein kinase [Streptomyces tricolor]|nr:protein kinase [Streptomyces tricolor]